MTAPWFDGSQECASASDAEWWWPDPGQSTNSPETGLAMKLCRECRFRVPCLEWAVAHEHHGVWGGTTERQRETIRRQRRRRAAA